METHITESNLVRLMAAICPGWSFVSNHSEDDDGRIILFWKAPTVISVLHCSRQTLTYRVSSPSIVPFTATAVYVAYTAEERRQLWDDLARVQHTFSFTPLLG